MSASSSPGSPEDFLPRIVGKVVNSHAGSTGSCFLIDSSRVLTSWHLVRDLTADCLQVSWPRLGESHAASLESADSVNDLAVLRLQGISAAEVAEVIDASGARPFGAFGYRHADDFEGLFASGDILGVVMRAGSTDQKLLQLRSTSLDRGMSGAPVLSKVDGRWSVVGMVAGIWDAPKVRDGDMAFAVPGHVLLRATLPPLRTDELGTRERRVVASSDFLAQDRFDDGAWGKSFVPKEGVFSQDARMPGSHEGKRALSVTSWAATALLRTAGDRARPYALQSKPFVMSAYLPGAGAFGHVHRFRSATPFVPPVESEMANPRHTGSAVSFLLEVDGPSPVVARALRFLADSADADGGWGEGVGGEPNSLATAFVVDALSKSLEQWQSIAPFLLPHESERLRGDLEAAREEALDWLVRRQRPDGTWPYLKGPVDEVTAPSITAHVVAFAPEVLESSQRVETRLIAYINGQMGASGGVPVQLGGTDVAAPSLMVAYGLRRLGERFAALAEELATLGVLALNRGEVSNVRTMAHIFLLLYESIAERLTSVHTVEKLVGGLLTGHDFRARRSDIVNDAFWNAWYESARPGWSFPGHV